MLRDEGAGGLYGGAVSNLCTPCRRVFYFLAFSAFKRTYEERMKTKINAARRHARAARGCCNVLVTEPLDTYTTRKQLKAKMWDVDENHGESDGDEGFKDTHGAR